MVDTRFDESGSGTDLLDQADELLAQDCDEASATVDPDTDECLRVMIDPGQASEAEIQRTLDALSELHEAIGGDGFNWCSAGPGEGGAP